MNELVLNIEVEYVNGLLVAGDFSIFDEKSAMIRIESAHALAEASIMNAMFMADVISSEMALEKRSRPLTDEEFRDFLGNYFKDGNMLRAIGEYFNISDPVDVEEWFEKAPYRESVLKNKFLSQFKNILGDADEFTLLANAMLAQYQREGDLNSEFELIWKVIS